MKKSLNFLVLVVLTISSSACGRNFSGTYTGTELLSYNGMNSNTAPITLSMVQSTNDELSAIWEGQYTKAALLGRPAGARIEAATLNLSFSAMQTSTGSINTSPPTPGTPQATPPNCGPYTGILNVQGNTISGTLTRSNPPAVTGPIIDPNYNCPTSRTINVSR